MAYSNSTKPSGSFSNSSEPSNAGLTWANAVYTYASYTMAWNASTGYVNSSKPSGSFSNQSKP